LFDVEYGSGSGHSAEDEGQPNLRDQIGFARKAAELSDRDRAELARFADYLKSRAAMEKG